MLHFVFPLLVRIQSSRSTVSWFVFKSSTHPSNYLKNINYSIIVVRSRSWQKSWRLLSVSKVSRTLKSTSIFFSNKQSISSYDSAFKRSTWCVTTKKKASLHIQHWFTTPEIPFARVSKHSRFGIVVSGFTFVFRALRFLNSTKM